MSSFKLGVLGALSLAVPSVALAQVTPRDPVIIDVGPSKDNSRQVTLREPVIISVGPSKNNSLNPPAEGIAVIIKDGSPDGFKVPTKDLYHLAATWKLAGEGGWDYLTMDASAHRLYIPRGTRIQVLDSLSGALIGEVPGVTGAHGVALDPELHRAFATSGRDNTVLVFDTQTLKPIGQPIPVGDRPDAITYDPITKRVFAFDAGESANGNAATVIDAQTLKVLQSVPLGSNPESAVPDGKGSVWVNLEGSSELVQIDAASGKILGRHSLAPGEEPTGIGLDVANSRVFSGCANKKMIVTDIKTGKQLAAVPIGEGVDAGAFDPKNGLAFASNGRDGTLSVVNFASDSSVVVVQNIPTHIGARTMALDPTNGDVFVVAADYLPAEPVSAGERPRRPRMVPGSAIVMKFQRNSTP